MRVKWLIRIRRLRDSKEVGDAYLVVLLLEFGLGTLGSTTNGLCLILRERSTWVSMVQLRALFVSTANEESYAKRTRLKEDPVIHSSRSKEQEFQVCR